MFKIKKFEINAGYEYLAMILEKDMKELRLNPKDRIKIVNPINGKFVICVLEVISFNGNKNTFKDINLKEGELGVYEKAFEKLEIIENHKIDILPAEKPLSLEHLKRKSKGHRLQKNDFKEIIADIVDNVYSEVETTFFVLACSFHPLNDVETIYLTEAMVEAGKILKFDKDIVVDKHCIGGIPNNRTSMLIVPILAAAGLTVPKSSSRSITSPAGTADTMEVLCDVEIPLLKMHNQVKEIGGCIVWGGSLDLSPADDLIIQVEHPLEIDSEGQMIASILSKKKSVGSTHVLIDIPVGKTAKVKTHKKAEELSSKFISIGSAIGLKVKTIITDGSEPIGNGVGPLYEALDVLEILENKENAPHDLKEKALRMSGIIMEMAGHSKNGEGYANAKFILETGLALEKFTAIVNMQGKKKIPTSGKYKYDFVAGKSGKVIEINNVLVSKLAFILGAPQDKSAGLILHKKTKDEFKKGDILFTLYTNSEMKLKYGKKYLEENFIYNLK